MEEESSQIPELAFHDLELSGGQHAQNMQAQKKN